MTAFAESKDVEARLLRPLTSAEKAAAESVIRSVTGLVIDSANLDQAWADTLDPVPEALRSLCVEKALTAINNPAGLTSQTETIGTYTLSQAFARTAGAAIFLTPLEERMVSRAVFGTTSGSSKPVGMFDREIEMAEYPLAEIVDDDPRPND